MNPDACKVTVGELVAAAAKLGRQIDRRWLSKHARAGLFPQPLGTPGLGPAKGRHSIYPPEAMNHLAPLLWALTRHGKNLKAVGWSLWLEGAYAAPLYWRDRIGNAGRTWERIKQVLSTSDTTEVALEKLILALSQEVSRRKDSGRLIGAIKRHLPEGITDFLGLIISVINGSYVSIQESSHDPHTYEFLQKLFSKPLSIPNEPDAGAAHELALPIDVRAMDEQLQRIALFAEIDIPQFLDNQPDSELISARSELIPIFRFAVALEELSKKQFGGTTGAKALTWIAQNQDVQAALLVGWLLLRRDPQYRENAEALAKLISDQFQPKGDIQNVAEIPK